MGEFLGKSKLDNLKTIINYNYFDKYTNNCANYPGITKAKSKLEGTFWINDISDILLNALCYVYIRKENTRINENLCKYLYYWLGSKVFTNLGHTYFFSEVVNTLYGILSEGKLGKVCNPVNYNIRYYNFQKFKDIYDLSEDYDTYKLHFATFKQSCDKDYENTIKSYKFLYNELRKECSMRKTDYNAQYCKAFNDYFTDDKNEEISSWICELKETEEQDEQLEVEHGEDSDKEQIPERFSVEGLQVRADWVENAQHSRSIVSYLNKELFDGESFSSTSEDSSPTIKKSITSAVSAAGVLVPPFLIYNVISFVIVLQGVLFYIKFYTFLNKIINYIHNIYNFIHLYAPARSWINKLLGMNKGTNRNPYANQELMADFSMPEDFYSERNRYNIMYNPE